jgi:hypothetical protein
MTNPYAGTITGPIAPYSNVPINPQYYQPRSYEISAISLGATTTVTTVDDDDYVIGQQVRLMIPPGFGARQLNGLTGYVIALPASNQVTIDINSRGGNAFSIPASATQIAQIVAIGDVNSGPTNSSGRTNNINYIQGAFINISPN